ncbi:MAG: type I DNA topoisomerase, partial [Deltaproteobacteria bacterium]|nr:type I DNA topoisomerase [Deltaproteobacteria bacterium]
LKTIERKERRRHAPPPFITSRIQQDASQKLGFSAKKTMVLAQQLYEGVSLGDEGPIGLITYMRTDSTRVSPSAIEAVRGYIHGQFGPSFVPPQPNFYKNKKAAQDAHEAIRPSSLDYPPDRVRPFLDRDQFRLYELIWKRFVASQMESAVIDQTTFQMTSGDYGLRATGSQIKFPGFLAAYQIDRLIEEKQGEEEADDEDRNLPALVEGETLKLLHPFPEQHFTEPPPRYNEASLIKILEEKGIGRPSTYAAIVSTILEKEYVAKETGKFTPTRLGVIVNKLLVENFPEILNVEFTAQMEGELDEVEEGRRHYVEALKDFYDPFEKTLEKAKKQMKNIKAQEIKTDLVCEKCNSPMIVKWGRRGEFVACSNYPECKNTREFQWNKEGEIELSKREVTGEFCSQCGSQMIIKSGRFGRFLACPKYPECKTTRAVSIGVSCPVCQQGKVTEKRSRKGRTFYGCTAYPGCKFASWDKPIPEKCPECKAVFLVVKFKKTGEEIRCATKGCEYTRPTASSS